MVPRPPFRFDYLSPTGSWSDGIAATLLRRQKFDVKYCFTEFDALLRCRASIMRFESLDFPAGHAGKQGAEGCKTT